MYPINVKTAGPIGSTYKNLKSEKMFENRVQMQGYPKRIKDDLKKLEIII